MPDECVCTLDTMLMIIMIWKPGCSRYCRGSTQVPNIKKSYRNIDYFGIINDVQNLKIVLSTLKYSGFSILSIYVYNKSIRLSLIHRHNLYRYYELSYICRCSYRYLYRFSSHSNHIGFKKFIDNSIGVQDPKKPNPDYRYYYDNQVYVIV